MNSTLLQPCPLPGQYALGCLQKCSGHMLHCDGCQASCTERVPHQPALLCLQDLNELQANAWIYWQAVENGEKGNWWGLMQVGTIQSMRWACQC